MNRGRRVGASGTDRHDVQPVGALPPLLPKGVRPARTPSLTTTSYAVLGVLWRRSSTASSLVTELRTLHAVWPRAESKLYEEPRKLVAHGLAAARTDPGGRRPRTTYTITDAGRAAFVSWLAQPAQPVALESEALLKASLADAGDPELLLERIDDLAAWSRHQLDEQRAALRRLARQSPRERAALDAVIARLLADLAATVDRWAAWAAAEVAGWESVAGAPLPEGMRTERPDDEPAVQAPNPSAR